MTTALQADPIVSPATARRAAIAGGVGTLIEYYDFTIYAFLTLIIGSLFFPSHNPTVSTLSALAVFASSYVVRPVGGWFFGRLGDRHGRRFALVATIVSMGAACGVMGLLPTYGQIGITATVLIVIARLAQGFAAGGELGGATTYVTELAPTGKRGLYGAATPMGATLGFAAAAAVVGAVRTVVPADQMSTWGWRLPFLLSIVLAIVSLWARMKVEDSPQFKDLEQDSAIERSPLLSVLRSHPGAVARVAGLSIAVNGVGYTGLTYLSIYLQQEGFSPTGVAWTSALCITLATLTFPFAGWLSDRFDRKPMLLVAYAISAAIAWPVFAILGATTSLFVVGVVYLVFMFFSGWSQVSSNTLMTELFPAKVRYSGVAFGYNIGTIIAGGTAPVVASGLVAATGNKTSPALWVVTVAVVGVITVASLGGTAKKPLPTV